MDWSQVWFCLCKGSQCYPDECHFGTGWVSFLPVCNEPQWGWTPCSPVPRPVSANELLNKSVLVPPLSPGPSSIPFQFTYPPMPLSTRTRHLALSPYPVMSPQDHLTSNSTILCLLIVSICLWDSLPFPCLKTVISKSLHVWSSLLLLLGAEIASPCLENWTIFSSSLQLLSFSSLLLVLGR